MPPDGLQSATFRSRKPRSWWVTPELRYLGAVLYVLEGANFQRGQCRGSEPVPPKFPEDIELKTGSKEELSAKRKAAREHLRKRRAEQEAEVRRGD